MVYLAELLVVMIDGLKIVRIHAWNVPRKRTQTLRRRRVSRVSLSLSLFAEVPSCWNIKQELSYRKQIARQLRTQYVEGTRPKYYTVTLKSRLRVTQGHWKRNHWTGHIQLTISRVIWRYYCDVTLKCGLEVTQGHWKWYHLKVWARFPIRLP